MIGKRDARFDQRGAGTCPFCHAPREEGAVTCAGCGEPFDLDRAVAAFKKDLERSGNLGERGEGGVPAKRLAYTKRVPKARGN